MASDLDTDLIGVISACCVAFLFVLLLTVVVGCYCYRRLERKRIKNGMRTAQYNGYHDLMVDPLLASAGAHPVENQTQASETDISGDVPYRLGSYRPKILAKKSSDTLSQEELLSASALDSEGDREYKRWKYQKQKHSKKDKDSKVDHNKAVSLVYVNSRHNAPNGHIGNVHGGQYVRGHPSQYRVQGEGQVLSGHKLVVYQNSGDLVHGSHEVTPTGAEIVHGHVVQSSSEQIVRGHHVKESSLETRQAEAPVQRKTVRLGGEEIVEGHKVRKDSIEVEPGETVVLVQHNGAQLIQPETRTGVEDSQPKVDMDIHTHQQQQLQSQVIHGHITTSEEQLVKGHYSKTFMESTLEAESRDVVTTTEVDSLAPVAVPAPVTMPAVGEATESGGVVVAVSNSEGVAGVVVGQDDADVSHGFMSDSENYKVIKKHHSEHTKLPDWLVQQTQYEESGASIDVEDEASIDGDQDMVTNVVSSVQQTEGMAVIGVDQPNAPSTVVVVRSAGGDDTTLTADYTAGTQLGDFTILDYVDPEPRTAVLKRTEDVTESYAETTATSSATVIKTVTTTTTMREMRQQVEDSAEKIPPMFTSTPRAPPEVQEAVASAMTEAAEGDENGVPRRQRPADTGGVNHLPPPSDLTL